MEDLRAFYERQSIDDLVREQLDIYRQLEGPPAPTGEALGRILARRTVVIEVAQEKCKEIYPE